MTSFIAKLWTRFHSKQVSVSIMFVGLDNSGKTSILKNLSSSELSPSSIELNKKVPFNRSRRLADRATQEGCESNEDANCENDWNLLLDSTDVNPGHITTSIDTTPRRQDSNWNSRPSDKIRPTVGYSYEVVRFKGQSVNVLDFSGQSKYRALWQEFLNCIDGIVFVIDSSDLIRLVVVRDELETILSNPYFGTLQPRASSRDTPGQSIVIGQAAMAANQQLQQKQINISQGKLILSPLDGAVASGSSSPQSDQSPNLHEKAPGSTNVTRDRRSRRRTKVPILLLANKTDLNNSADPEVITRALNLDQLVDKSRHPWLVQATSVNTNQGIFEGFNWLIGAMSAS